MGLDTPVLQIQEPLGCLNHTPGGLSVLDQDGPRYVNRAPRPGIAIPTHSPGFKRLCSSPYDLAPLYMQLRDIHLFV